MFPEIPQPSPCIKVPVLGTIVPIMGTTTYRRADRRTSSLGDALFTGTRKWLLGALFGNPARSFYARELIGLAASGSGAIQRELGRLTQSGLVTMHPIGNQKHTARIPSRRFLQSYVHSPGRHSALPIRCARRSNRSRRASRRHSSTARSPGTKIPRPATSTSWSLRTSCRMGNCSRRWSR